MAELTYLDAELIFINCPIPKQEDIKVQLPGLKILSKLGFKSTFWQLELHPDSLYYTVFHANNKLYLYTRLIMGVRPSQSDLNAALRSIFAQISHVFYPR